MMKTRRPNRHDPRARGRRGLSATLARAVPRRMAELGVDVDYVVIHVRPPRFIDAHMLAAMPR